jgi:hypothetical protein
VKFALGISIEQNLADKMIALGQTALIEKLICQFHLIKADDVPTPMVQGLKLQRPDPQTLLSYEESSRLTQTPYRSLMGSLIYIVIGTHPDIAYAVSKLTLFLDCYQSEHWEAALRVLRYLKGTKHMQLVLDSVPKSSQVQFSDYISYNLT